MFYISEKIIKMNSKLDQPMKLNPLYLGYQPQNNIIPQLKRR